LSRTQPNGRVLGVDIIPATPPKGMSTIQGNFLSPEVQAYVREFLRDRNRGRPRLLESTILKQRISDFNYDSLENRQDYERNGDQEIKGNGFDNLQEKRMGENQAADWTVDVVLSDMSAPWAQTRGFWKRSLSDPYYRMMNTSGVGFRDHSGSMVSLISHRMQKGVTADASRICVERLCNSVITFLKMGAISSASFTRGQKTKLLRRS